MKHDELARQEEARQEVNEKVRESFDIIFRECEVVIDLLKDCVNTRQIKNSFRAKKIRAMVRDRSKN